MLIAVLVISAGAVGMHRAGQPTVDQRASILANQVRCPVCSGETVQESNAPPSLAIRSQIHSELAAGEAPRAVLAGLVAAYGPGILEKPSTAGVSLVVWIAPIIAVAGAAVGLTLAFRRWRPSAGGASGAGGGGRATASDRRLVGEALGRPEAGPPGTPDGRGGGPDALG